MHALLTHLHRGLNSIIKNDHQRAHCKQMTVAGAWRTNSARGHMQQQPARFCSLLLLFSSFFFSPPADIYTRTSPRLLGGGGGFYQMKSRVLFFFLLGPPLRSLVCQESFSLTPAVGPSNQTQLSHRSGCTPDVLSGLIKHAEPTPLTPALPAATFLH